MAKFLGYLLAIIGLFGIVASSNKVHDLIPIIKTLPTNYILIAGIALVVIGIIFVIMEGKGSSSGKVKHASEEVPIYEGEGRKRKIVGYKRA